MNDLGNACIGFDASEIDELRAIAKTYRAASGPVIKLSNLLGDRVQAALKRVPEGWQKGIGDAADLALRASYAAASATHAEAGSNSYANRILLKFDGERSHQIAAGISGAIGGIGGVATLGADLAVTTTLIMRSIQQIAETYGEDLQSEEVRHQCLAVFGFGGPLTEDDDVETGLYGVRLALRGVTLEALLRVIAPRFGIRVSEKLLAQAIPVLGAVVGATINPIFTGYYQQMAHVLFRLRKLEKTHDPDQVRACFERVVKSQRGHK